MTRAVAANPLERRLEAELAEFRRTGVYKRLNYIDSPQDAVVTMEGRGQVIPGGGAPPAFESEKNLPKEVEGFHRGALFPSSNKNHTRK